MVNISQFLKIKRTFATFCAKGEYFGEPLDKLVSK